MNIDNVGNIDPKRNVGQARDTERARAEKTGRAEDKPRTGAADPGKSANVTLSRDVKRVAELTDAAEQMAREPRQDKVEAARSRIENGDYDRPETLRRVAAALLNIPTE